MNITRRKFLGGAAVATAAAVVGVAASPIALAATGALKPLTGSIGEWHGFTFHDLQRAIDDTKAGVDQAFGAQRYFVVHASQVADLKALRG